MKVFIFLFSVFMLFVFCTIIGTTPIIHKITKEDVQCSRLGGKPIQTGLPYVCKVETSTGTILYTIDGNKVY